MLPYNLFPQEHYIVNCIYHEQNICHYSATLQLSMLPFTLTFVLQSHKPTVLGRTDNYSLLLNCWISTITSEFYQRTYHIELLFDIFGFKY
jgi:hypothetical protein